MTPRLGHWILAASLVLGACSDDLVGPAPGEFDQLCGKQAPVRLLAMETDRVPHNVSAQKFGDRYVFSLRMADFSETSVVEVWSTGECGEDPVKLIEGVDRLFWGGYEPWPELPFVCDETSGRISALDPSGARPPHEVFETRKCYRQHSSQGIVTILGEGDTGPLVLQRWPADPLSEVAEQVVLLDEVQASARPSSHTFPNEVEVLQVVGDEVFAITADDQLVVVSLDDLEVNVLAEGVRELVVGPSGRYVVWQGVEITNTNPDWPEGPIFLLDRQSGQTTQIDETALAYTLRVNLLRLEPLGLLHYRVGAIDDATADRWVRLDTLESFAVPGLLRPWWRIDDTRAVLGRWGFASPLHVLDVTTGELTLLYDGPSHSRLPHPSGLWVHVEDNGEVLDVSFSGEVRTLARQATSRWQLLSGDRLVTPFAVGDDKIGSLIVVDSATLEERYIDHSVHALSTTTFESWPNRGDLISYMVVDSDPERHGIWLAKPAKW